MGLFPWIAEKGRSFAVQKHRINRNVPFSHPFRATGGNDTENFVRRRSAHVRGAAPAYEALLLPQGARPSPRTGPVGGQGRRRGEARLFFRRRLLHSPDRCGIIKYQNSCISHILMLKRCVARICGGRRPAAPACPRRAAGYPDEGKDKKCIRKYGNGGSTRRFL